RVGWDHRRLADETVELVQQALALAGRHAEVVSTTYRELFVHAVGLDPFAADDAQLRAPLAGIDIDGHGLGRDDWLDLLMTHRIQPQFPDERITVVHDWPASQCALARIRPGAPPVAERFELYIGGFELANGYHELTDAAEQAARFVRDQRVRAMRAVVQPPIDTRLLGALQAGLPDCAGVALGVERLLMALVGTQRIADVLVFDFVRA